MPIREIESNVKFNKKTKVYSEDFKVSTICNHAIFKNKAWELAEEKSSTIEETLKNYEELTGWSKTPFTDDEYVRNNFKEDKPKQYNTSADNVRDDNLKRAKDKVFDIVYMNDWNYFLTITFNDEVVNASDVPLVMEKVKVWLSNMVQRKGLQYILIPEYHKDKKRVHAHALINDTLQFVISGTYTHKQFHQPVSLETLHKYKLSVNDCQEVYNVENWKYGFSTAIKVYGDKGAISYYITKYLTKDTKKIFGKFYWSSRKIKREVPTILSNVSYMDAELIEFNVKGQNISYKYEVEKGNPNV